jgi:hypothetical protein
MASAFDKGLFNKALHLKALCIRPVHCHNLIRKLGHRVFNHNKFKSVISAPEPDKRFLLLDASIQSAGTTQRPQAFFPARIAAGVAHLTTAACIRCVASVCCCT